MLDRRQYIVCPMFSYQFQTLTHSLTSDFEVLHQWLFEKGVASWLRREVTSKGQIARYS